ncbi:hypothetical protein TNCV_2340261 [Trichonephila clavipes]|nr:hypothetical protein TNCV_2340261 [Trichonephila clavipes]
MPTEFQVRKSNGCEDLVLMQSVYFVYSVYELLGVLVTSEGVRENEFQGVRTTPGVCERSVAIKRLGSIALDQRSHTGVPKNTGGCSSRVVEVTDSWPACHEFQLSTAEYPPCREVMHIKFVEGQLSFRWCTVEIRRWVPARVPSWSLDYG